MALIANTLVGDCLIVDVINCHNLSRKFISSNLVSLNDHSFPPFTFMVNDAAKIANIPKQAK